MEEMHRRKVEDVQKVQKAVPDFCIKSQCQRAQILEKEEEDARSLDRQEAQRMVDTLAV